MLTPTSISETGGVSTVTATLSGASSVAVTVTVAAAPVASTGAVSGDFTLSTATTLTIAAGETTSAGTVTVTANGNSVHSPNKSVTVSGTASGGRGVAAPPNVTLALTDDDDALPTAALVLTPTSISETGGVSTVTATLSGASSVAVTVTVATAPVASTGAVSGDFTLSTAATLTIAAGETMSTGTVTVAANGNDVDAPDKSVTVSGTAAEGNSVVSPSAATLTLTDDDTAGVSVSPATSTTNRLVTTESGGTATFTVELDSEPTGNVVLGVASSDTDEGTAAPSVLTFTSGDWGTAQTVTLTGVDDSPPVIDGSRNYTVSLTVNRADTQDSTYDGLSALTVYARNRDDEFGLDVGAVSGQATEAGGKATFTVALLTQPSAAVTVTVSSRDGSEGTVSPSVLTFTTSGWNTAQTVTVTGVQDTVDDGTVAWQVRLDPSSGDADYDALDNEDVAVSTTDDDALPKVSLVLTPSSIWEGGAATVTATLSRASSEAVTVTVAAAPVASTGAVSGDFTLSTAATLTIAAGATTSTGTVTVTANGNDVDAPNKSVTVSGTASGGNGVANPPNVTLTLTDDDALPTVSLVLTPSSISEGGAATVTATLSGASSRAVTVTVAAARVASTDARAADFTLSGTKTLTIAAGATTSTGTVTVTAHDNDVDAPNKSVTVSGTASGGNGVANPPNVTLTLTDDDALPKVSLVLTPSSIWEGGAATVTATLSGASSRAVRVTVAAAAVASTDARAADFTLSGTKTLTIAAGATTSTGTVTVTARDNDVDAPDGSVWVSGRATGGNGVLSPPRVTLTLTDDDTAGISVSPTTSPTSRLVTSESGGRATFTVKLDSEPTGDVVLHVRSDDSGEGRVGRRPWTLTRTFTPSDWSTAQTVILTGVNDSVADGRQRYTVTLRVDRVNTADAKYDTLFPVTVYAVNRDNEVGLDVGEVSGQATEAGGQATFRVALNRTSREAVTVTVSSRDGGEGEVSPSTLVFSASSAPYSWRLVTVTGVQDVIDDGTVTWRVRLDPSSGDADYDALDNVDVSVSTADDDGPPGVVLSLNPASVSENGGTATVTARLSHPSDAATTVTVAAVPGTGAGAADFTLSTKKALTIAAGAWASTGVVTVTANDDTVDSPDKSVTVTATVANDRAAADSATMAVTGASLTLTDDDAAPTAALSLAPASVSENGGVSTVTAVLSHPSSEPSTVTVAAVAGAYTVGTDATIVIAAGATAAASDTVLVTAVDDSIRQGTAGRSATVTATLTNGQGAGAVTGGALTLTDDDMAGISVSPTTSPTSRLRTTESAGTATFTVKLDSEPTGNVVLGAASSDTDEGTVSPSVLTFTPSDWSDAQTVTLTGVDDSPPVADGGQGYTVILGVIRGSTADARYGARSALTVYASNRDNDDGRLDVGEVSGQATEAGGKATFPVALRTQPSAAVTVAVSSRDGGEGTVAPSSLTFAPSAWNTAQTVTVTGVQDPVDDGTVLWAVRLGSSSGDADYAGAAYTDVSVSTTDDDGPPGVVLSLNPTSVAENGGISTVTATLSHPSGAATTLTVTPVSGAFTVGADATIVIAAGATADAFDTATVAAVDNPTVAPARTETVTATVANDRAAADSTTMAVTGASLTLTDDDNLPTVALVLSDSSVLETGGAATVTATLSNVLSGAVTVTVAASAGAGAVAADFVLSTATTLTIAAGSTTSTGTVTVTANDNDVDSPNKSVTVSGTASGGDGVVGPPNVTLTLTDDDTAGISVLPTTSTTSRLITTESAGTDTFTVELDSRPTGIVVLTVASSNTAEGTVSPSPLVFTPSDWSDAQPVTVTRVDDSPPAADGSRDYTVTLTVNRADTQDSTYDRLSAQTVYVRNDESGLDAGEVRGQATERGGKATFPVALVSKPSTAVTVAVSSRDRGEGTVSPSTLTFAPPAWNTAQTVTVTGVQDAVDDGTVIWAVRLDPSSGDADYDALDNEDVSVGTTDDDGPPRVLLSANPSSVSENGGVSTVTARLSHPSSAATTVTVTPVAGAWTVGAGIVIAAGATTSTDTALVTGTDDAIHTRDRTKTVTATVTNDRAAADSTTMAVTGASLTLTDDETLPTAALVLTPSSISETGGISTVTATLPGPSSETMTVAVTVAPVASTGAVWGDFTLSGRTLTIAAGATTSTGTVTVTANGNDVDTADKEVTVWVWAVAAGGRSLVGRSSEVTLTLTDDDTAGISVSPRSGLQTTESGGTDTFTVKLDSKPTGDVWLGVDLRHTDWDEGAVSPRGLTFTPSDWSTAQTVTLTGVDDSPPVLDGHQRYTVKVTVNESRTADAKYLTLSVVNVDATNRDNEAGFDIGEVSGQATEAGGIATFPVALVARPSTTVTVRVYSWDQGEGTASPSSLTFAPSAWNAKQTVRVTGKDDDIDDGTVAWGVALDPSGGNYWRVANDSVRVSTTDDDGPPGVVLSLSPTSVAESGGISTVTATLSHPSSAATTLTVAPVAGAYAAGADATIVIAAGETANTSDTATVAAANNTTDEPARTVTVTAAVANDRAAADSTTMVVTGASLTLTDDDAAPSASLSLDPASVSENGGVSTVTATLSHPSSEPSTVTVTAASGLYTVGSDATIVIAAGETTAASDTALVTAVDDDVHQGAAGRSATVSATLANGQGAGAVTGASLTLTDDDAAPTASLSLDPSSVSENGGVSTVTATLSRRSAQATTVTVWAASGLYTVGSDATIVIAAGETTATTDTALVTAVDDDVHQGAAGRSATVSATLAGGRPGLGGAVTGASLTLTDDDALPTVSLVLTPSSISKTNGASTVSATLSGASGEAVTVYVYVRPGTGAAWGDFSRSTKRKLIITAGATTSTGTVTVTANGNVAGTPDKEVTVSGWAVGGNRIADPPDVTLTLEAGDEAPTVALALSDTSITETGGAATVTATLTGKSSEAVTVTVAASAGTGAVAADFALSTATTLTIAAGATTSTGLVTVTANDNDVYSRKKSVTVSGTAVGGNGVTNPSAVTLTLTDDDGPPTVALVLTPNSISETGGISTVTATLTGKSSEAATVTVRADDDEWRGDFALSAARTLTIAAGETASTGLVTVTANDDDVYSPNKTVAVRGLIRSGIFFEQPWGATLTLEDDDEMSPVALALSDTSISETGGAATVTATLSNALSEAVTVTVAAAAGRWAVSGDFALSTATTLTIAAGSTTSTGLVTVTATGNDAHTNTGYGHQVTVSGTAAGGNGVANPSNVILTLNDDDALPTGALVLTPSSISETGGVSTVTATLSGPLGRAVTVWVSSFSSIHSGESDLALLSAARTLTIAARATTSTGLVTVTAIDNDVDYPEDYSVPILGTERPRYVEFPYVWLTLEDDDALPTVALALSDTSISETGGVSTVTATLSGKSSNSVLITVGATAGTGAVAADFALSTATTLLIAAGSTTSTGLVTVTATGNDVDSPNKSVTVSGTAAGGRGVANPPDVTLTLEDDDEAEAPTVALALSDTSITETGGAATVTATLSNVLSDAVTVTVAAAAGRWAVSGDFALSTATTLTIAAGSTTSTGPGDGDGDRQRRVFAAEQGGDGLGDGGGRQRRSEPVERDSDPEGRRRPAEGGAGAHAELDYGDGRGVDGDRDALAPVERCGDGDGAGVGDALDGRGRGGLRPERGEDADHRGGGHDERGHGDGDREQQRRGCAGQAGDGVVRRDDGGEGRRRRIRADPDRDGRRHGGGLGLAGDLDDEPAGDDGVCREGDVHGGAGQRADGERGARRGELGHGRGHGVAVGPDLHVGRLGHGADGDGDRG